MITNNRHHFYALREQKHFPLKRRLASLQAFNVKGESSRGNKSSKLNTQYTLRSKRISIIKLVKQTKKISNIKRNIVNHR